MTGMLGNAWLWVKAAHVVFVIFWMAGLFALPRYMIHHQDALERGDAPDAERWIERETLLRRMILVPSMGMTWLFGLALAFNLGLADGAAGLGWLHAKLALVVAMSAYNGWAVGYARKLAQGRVTIATRRLRAINELPALGIVLIVVLAVVRPF